MSLRDIANAATPGPWELQNGRWLRSTHPAMSRAGTTGDLMYPDGSGWEHDGDLEFIATFDPQLVSRLLDIADAARAVTEEWHRRGDHGCSVELQVALLDALGATEVTA